LIICLILDCYLISFVRYCNSVPIALLGHVFLGHAVWYCNCPDIVIFVPFNLLAHVFRTTLCSIVIFLVERGN